MRDRPHPNHKLEWPGGVVPEWARPQQNGKKRFGKGRGKGERQGGSSPSKRERLQKVMAQSGHGSRRNIEILIAQGHITINGQVAKLGDAVGPGDKVKLDGNPINLRFGDPLPRVLIYNKPDNEIVSRDDPEKRATVFDRLPKVNGGRWVSVGRLDLNTGGLLLFTTNGELANRLTHPRFQVEREYAVRLLGTLTDEQVDKLTKTGVEIEGDNCTFDSLEDRGGEGANHWYHVVLREGKNREVRKMMEAVGMVVSRLIRVRFGNVQLPGHIKRGMYREMEEEQVQELLAFAGMNEPPPSEAGSEDDEEDELDNIGNRFDAPPPRELSDEELDEIVSKRVHQQYARVVERAEPDGNRGTYVPGGAPEAGNRAPKKGRPQGQPGQGPRQGPPRGGKPFAFGKKRHGKGQGGQPHQRREADGNVAPRQPQALPAAAPRPPQGQAAAGTPGQGKPGRNRRNKNRNRNRGGGGGGGGAGGGNAQGRGDQQPTSNGNRETF
ncbi:MAG TPA: pseudouridine synthase [Usitatibacter sp.]|nr:pseudouridine synthase [Usitatibacter sp.]